MTTENSATASTRTTRTTSSGQESAGSTSATPASSLQTVRSASTQRISGRSSLRRSDKTTTYKQFRAVSHEAALSFWFANQDSCSWFQKRMCSTCPCQWPSRTLPLFAPDRRHGSCFLVSKMHLRRILLYNHENTKDSTAGILCRITDRSKRLS